MQGPRRLPPRPLYIAALARPPHGPGGFTMVTLLKKRQQSTPLPLLVVSGISSLSDPMGTTADSSQVGAASAAPPAPAAAAWGATLAPTSAFCSAFSITTSATSVMDSRRKSSSCATPSANVFSNRVSRSVVRDLAPATVSGLVPSSLARRSQAASSCDLRASRLSSLAPSCSALPLSWCLWSFAITLCFLTYLFSRHLKANGAKIVAHSRAQMTMEKVSESSSPPDRAIWAIRYANSARPTMAQPITNLEGPMKIAQTTFVKMQGPAPMIAPFQNASTEINEVTGMENATVHEKKIRIIHEVTRLVCFTQTSWACPWGSRHAKDMPAMKQPHRCVPHTKVIVA
mmetsp:Transcript_107847/g.281550  ORF Transcript_107847/g.281550 Transcript_107847/m.281550 type:complete len:344 (+) Transcript_107847:45-1076(+)